MKWFLIIAARFYRLAKGLSAIPAIHLAGRLQYHDQLAQFLRAAFKINFCWARMDSRRELFYQFVQKGLQIIFTTCELEDSTTERGTLRRVCFQTKSNTAVLSSSYAIFPQA